LTRLGVLGGTFDPIHVGHLAAAHAAIECAQLDQVLFVPSAQPPHRATAVGPANDRLEMARLAIENEPRFDVSDVEVARGGRSYTVDTMSELHAAHPGDDLFLILGWDAARLFKTWREPERVSDLASVVIIGRPGMLFPTPADIKAAGLDPARVIVCTIPTPDISGSALRRAIAAGESVSGQVPASVALYITEHRLYGDNR
jgi:nicotinate-nucleotide adenylyltransferase